LGNRGCHARPLTPPAAPPCGGRRALPEDTACVPSTSLP
jgi:hypothetical protein